MATQFQQQRPYGFFISKAGCFWENKVMGLVTKHIVLLVILLQASVAYANWLGPQEIVTGTWGSNPGQFGIIYDDADDGFPRTFCVSSTGVIAIADEYNSRIQTFKGDGSLIGSFGPQAIADNGWRLDWPLRIGCMSNSVYTEYDKYTQIYDNTGTLIMSHDNLIGGLVDILSNDNFVSWTSTAYYLYSPVGQLIKTYSQRPLEVGQVQSVKLSKVKYKLTISYPDKIYGLTADREFIKYIRTTNDKIYGINPGGVRRFNLCGKQEGFLLMPEGKQDEIPGQGAEEPQVYVSSDYGEPVIAPNGDVYTWKRTPDNYSILKWTWVDDPNVPTGPDAPTNLKVAASINGLYLTWTASPQDPGCVTGYKIDQATTSGGHYTTIATVNAGAFKYNDTTAVAGTTHYYKIKAVSGSDYSPYTSEVSGKR